MTLRHSPGYRRLISLIASISIFLCLIYTSSGSSSRRSYSRTAPAWLPPANTDQKPVYHHDGVSLPELESIPPTRADEPEYCVDRFSPRYIDQLREHRIQYCSGGSRARLTCFHSHVRSDDNHDAFCIGQNAVLDVDRREFSIDCDIRQPDANEAAKGLLPFSSLKPYWYSTGPKVIFDSFVRVQDTPELSAAPEKQKKDFALLVKREGSNNLWHSLMEIWSMTLAFDTLRATQDPSNGGAPFFESPEDILNTQIILLDDHAQEATFDLWRLFSKKPPLRLKEISNDPVQAQAFANKPLNIILPLPGAANSLWQNDWVARDCTFSPLLRLFVRRVFAHLGIPYEADLLPPPPPDPHRGGANTPPPLTLTFLDRRGTRKLRGQDALLAALRRRFGPTVLHVQAVDLGRLPLAEQLRVVRDTDVLVGVHGAGLTHTMFMREGAGAVVELLPEGFLHKGFRNLAGMTGQAYFSAHAEMVLSSEKEEEEEKREQGSSGGEDGGARQGVRRAVSTGRGHEKRNDDDQWQRADVRIEEERFVALVEMALDSLRSQTV